MSPRNGECGAKPEAMPIEAMRYTACAIAGWKGKNKLSGKVTTYG